MLSDGKLIDSAKLIKTNIAKNELKHHSKLIWNIPEKGRKRNS